MGPEARVAKKVMRFLSRTPTCFASKIHGGPMQRSGLPDVTGCHRGIFFGIELKAPGKEKNLTPNQEHKLQKIREAGGVAGVASKLSHVRKILDECTEKAEGRT